MSDVFSTPFSRYILVSNDDRHIYRHVEHGGIVTDPHYADTCQNISVFLREMKETANRDFKCFNPWNYAQMSTTIKLLSGVAEIERFIDAEIRTKALAKLTTEEKKVLGL